MRFDLPPVFGLSLSETWDRVGHGGRGDGEWRGMGPFPPSAPSPTTNVKVWWGVPGYGMA